MADDDESKAGERTTKISDHLESFTKHAGGDNRPGKVTITRKRSLKPTKLRGEDLPSGSTANKCSFCSRSFAEKEKCVEGDAGVLICSDCIKLCNKILDEDTPDKSSL